MISRRRVFVAVVGACALASLVRLHSFFASTSKPASRPEYCHDVLASLEGGGVWIDAEEAGEGGVLDWQPRDGCSLKYYNRFGCVELLLCLHVPS
jgi:hypothetical protein